jgi:hypothetical protein
MLTDAVGRVTSYVVTGRRKYPRTLLPSLNQPADVFDQTVPERLVLVTCGGRFDRRIRHYVDNVVAYATPAGR